MLLTWSFCIAYGRAAEPDDAPARLVWRTTFYKAVDTGSGRIADHLNKRAVMVR